MGMPNNVNDNCFTTCGDGIVAGNEECDDANNNNLVNINTDGCANCNIVRGWECTGDEFRKFVILITILNRC